MTCGNRHDFPIRAGIPRFVPDDGYAENFALEWHQHARTQYDSAESTESAETFAAKTGSLVPKYTALRRDLADYLELFNYERAHDGRYTKGRTPAELVYGARTMRPR